jgi:hypothetical protein
MRKQATHLVQQHQIVPAADSAYPQALACIPQLRVARVRRSPLAHFIGAFTKTLLLL